jgi:histidine triad (HIT) family protein
MAADCIFCKIAAGEIPAEKIYEDDKILAFLDLKPSSRGHALVIHKFHTADFASTPDGILNEIVPAVKRIAAGIMKATGAAGFNLTTNNGPAAGQVVFHLHFHIIPRYAGDGLKLFPQHESEKSKRQMLAEEIKKNLA